MDGWMNGRPGGRTIVLCSIQRDRKYYRGGNSKRNLNKGTTGESKTSKFEFTVSGKGICQVLTVNSSIQWVR